MKIYNFPCLFESFWTIDHNAAFTRQLLIYMSQLARLMCVRSWDEYIREWKISVKESMETCILLLYFFYCSLKEWKSIVNRLQGTIFHKLGRLDSNSDKKQTKRYTINNKYHHHTWLIAIQQYLVILLLYF